MKEEKLDPSSLIVPGEIEVGNDQILAIYFHLAKQGLLDKLPPAIVAPGELAKGLFDVSQLNHTARDHQRQKLVLTNFRRILDELLQVKGSRLLLDGNHKAIAAQLCHTHLRVLVLESQTDIDEGIRMAKAGELLNWSTPNTIDELLRQLEDKLQRHLDMCVMDAQGDPNGLTVENTILTVSQRVGYLIEAEEIPQYMIDRYSQKA